MAVNESVYGAANTWTNAYYQQSNIVNKNKIANFGDNTYTLAQGVSKGKLSYTEGIDKSISFCGLGTESALSHIAFITRTSSNTAEVLTENNRDVTNFGFFERVDNSMTFEGTDYRTNAKQNYVWGDYSNLYNFTKTLRPLTVVNPHNLVLCIYLKCADANHNNPITVTLKSYMQNYTQTRPRIYKVWVQPYFGDTIPRSTDAGRGTPEYRKPLQIGLLDEYDFTAKNLKFNSYQLQTTNVIFGSFASGDYFYNLAESYAVVAFTPNSREHLKIEYISGGDYYRTSFEYYDDFEEDILKTVACFGLYFTTDNTVAQSGALTNNDMYIGILDSQGVGHGQYFRGADTVRAPQAANDYTDMHTSGYDPSTPYIDYDNTPHYGTASYESINKMYALTGQQVLQVMSELSDAMSAIPSDMNETEYSTGTFLTSNPIDCIVSLRKYPVYNTAKNTAELYPVMFGGYESQISAPYAKNVQVFRFDFTDSKAFISNFDNSFLDREPYTTAELYIPFCGTVKLSCDEFINHAIGVRLVLDYRTGSALAYIERDGIPQMSVGGDMGIDIPLTGVQTQTLANTIRRNIANLKQAQISAVQAASGGATMSAGDNPLQLVGGMINIANRIGNVNKALLSNEVASYSLHHTEIPFKSISTGDAVTGMSGEWCCRLSITRPVLSPDFDPETYGKTIGYACLKQGKVSDFTGLTVGTIDLTGINAPAEVKTMIQAAFKQGVYL